MVQIVFTKGAGKQDRMEVVRGGVPAEVIHLPKQGIIPHDMVHFAVESTLRKRGFLMRVAEGEEAAFRMQPEAESESVERLVEVFQADGWAGWATPVPDMLQLYRVSCDARRCEMLDVSPEDMEAIRQCILDLSARWQRIPVGDALTLELEDHHDHR